MNVKKQAALFLSLVMAAALSVPALAAEEQPVLISAPVELPQVEQGDVVILHTNDVHTHIDGDIRYSHVAGLKEYLEELGADVILVDAGDAIQGTAYGSMDDGRTIQKLMEAAGYDLATLGNHEFDYGMDRTLELVDGKVTYLSCNFYHQKNGVVGDTVLEPYKIVEAGGKKLAFLGITTPEAFTKSTPAYFQDGNGQYIYGIAGGEDGRELYETVQATVDEVMALGGIDYIGAIGHLGVDLSSRPWTSEELLANTAGIDLFLDGHSHTEMVKEFQDTGENLLQTGDYLSGIGVTVLSEEEPAYYLLDKWELEAMGVVPDAKVKAMEEQWINEVDRQLGEIIGYTEVTLDNYDADGNRLVRKQATNSGAFSADALYYLFDSMAMDVDVAVMNGGGVRNKAITGELTYKHMKEINAFGNVACLITVTGQQLLDALEWGARDVGVAESGAFLHAAGLRYAIDPSIPATIRTDDKGVWAGGPTGAYRVQDVTVLNRDTGAYEPLDLKAEYNLAGYNYTLRDLGDGFAMFGGAVNVVDYVMEDYLILANFVKAFPVDPATDMPTISAENGPTVGGIQVDYSDVNMPGRITIKTAGAAVPDQPEASVPTAPAGQDYVVVAGDCLWNLASRYLGSGIRFGEIAAANGLTDPYTIYVGQTLRIPAN